MRANINIQGLRKSLKSDKERRASSSTSHSRMSSLNASSSNFTASLIASSTASMNTAASSKETPKKIIKASQAYTAQNANELSFAVGDFFWVMGRENDMDFYEACNPLTNVKGLVPVNCFEVINQTKRPDSLASKNSNSFIISNLHLSNSPNSISSERFSSGSRRPSITSNPMKSPQPGAGGQVGGVLYGIVMYDFEARPDSDELDVKKGEYLILCAHHEYEWFIAKPINRLGGPGLVPVAYIKTLNLASKKISSGDIVQEIKDCDLPTVAEWKKQTAKYKAASINLGEEDYYQNGGQGNVGGMAPANQQRTLYEYDDNSIQSQFSSNHSSSLNMSSFNTHGQPPQSYSIFTNSRYDSDHCSLFDKNVYVESVKIVNFYYNKQTMNDRNGRFWYHVIAKLSNGNTRSLARYYDDFYEFQVQLKESFPDEAMKHSDKERIIPFIPAPVPNVNLQVTFSRFEALNEYLQELIQLPEYISRSKTVLIFFNLREEVDKQSEIGDADFPEVVGYNDNGLESLKAENEEADGFNPAIAAASAAAIMGSGPGSGSGSASGPSSGAAANAGAVTTQPPPSINSNSARSSADTKESQLSYQIGQLNLKTDSVITNATSNSEAVTNPINIGSSEEKSQQMLANASSPTISNNAYIGTPPTNSALNTPTKNTKIKFYYEDDIFAISVPTNTTLLDLKLKISTRINHNFDKIKLFVRTKVTEFNDDVLNKEIDRDEYLRAIMKKDPKLKLLVITDDSTDGDEDEVPDKI